jgi:hypothetical protein
LRAFPERANASLTLIQEKNVFEAKMVIFVFRIFYLEIILPWIILCEKSIAHVFEA